jgi:hypothetical protein
MAPSCLKATGIGIKIPSIFRSLAIGAPFNTEILGFAVSIAHPILYCQTVVDSRGERC